jgi:sugar O-acyltransferase (sialic acid O-acetyltransferase NeuD family)
MSKNVVVFCAGSHAKVVIDSLKAQEEFKLVGIIDSVLEIGSMFYGYEVIGKQNELDKLIQEYHFQSGIVALGDNYLREKLVLEIIKQNADFDFINVISPHACISLTATLGVGNVIMPGVIVNSEAIIGNHCIINTNSSLEHNSEMDDFSSLSPGVITGGYVKLGRYAAIALGVTIFDRTTIGVNVVVGSGSLVTKNLDSHGLYYGIPAKRIRDRKSFERFLK